MAATDICEKTGGKTVNTIVFFPSFLLHGHLQWTDPQRHIRRELRRGATGNWPGSHDRLAPGSGPNFPSRAGTHLLCGTLVFGHILQRQQRQNRWSLTEHVLSFSFLHRVKELPVSLGSQEKLLSNRILTSWKSHSVTSEQSHFVISKFTFEPVTKGRTKKNGTMHSKFQLRNWTKLSKFNERTNNYFKTKTNKKGRNITDQTC